MSNPVKSQIKLVLIRSGVLPAVLQRRRGSYILMFHGITEGRDSGQALDQALAQLVRQFQFSALNELLTGSAQHGRPRLFLTFDDGLRNNFTVVYPLLKKHAVPATFFVCPGLVDSGAWIWTHETRERLRGLEDVGLTRLGFDLLGEAVEIEEFISRLKALSITACQDAVQRIRRATPNFRPRDAQRAAFDLMNWNEIRQLDPDLVTIGSHSMTHAMLDAATFEQAEYEVAESRRLLECTLQRPVLHFCYPAGQFGPMAEAVVRRTYQAAVTTQPGRLPTGDVDVHRLPRVGASEQLHELQWSLFRAGPKATKAS